MNPIRWLRNLAKRNAVPASSAWGGRRAGEYVTADTAMQVSAVWACVRVISETLAALPWHVYEKSQDAQGRTRRERRDGDIAWLLQTQASPEMSALAFREAIAAHALTWGNGYAEIERSPDGRPVWLWLLTPDRVVPERMPTGGLQYRVRSDGVDTIVPARDMLHIKGLAFDGIVGYSPIAIAARSLGLTMALESFGAKFFENGAHPGAVLEHPAKLSAEAHKNLQESVAAQISGGNALKPFILEEGMKWHAMTIPPEEAQFLESRKFQISEVCRWFRVPPHMVADLDRSTFSNIEHQQIEFVTHTLMPWCRRFEAEVDLKLFGRVNAGRVYTKIELGGLLRGDMKSRFEAYAIARHLSLNDIRELEDMNPVRGGDDYLAQINLAPVDMLREIAETHAAPPAPAEPPADPGNDEPTNTNDPPLRAVRGGR